MKTFILLIASFFASGQIMQPAGILTTPAPASGCALSGAANDWPMWGTSNTCNGGSACTNGTGIDTAVDTVAANNATQSTSGNRPNYVTASLNGLAAADFSVASTTALTLTTPVCQTGCVMTWLFVFKPGASGTNYTLLGESTLNGFEARVNTTQHLEILEQGVASKGVSTGTFTTGTWYAEVVQYDQTSGSWAMFKCTSGTCSADGSGGSTWAANHAIDSIGRSNADGSFKTSIAEVARWTSTTITGIGAYTSCKYGL